MIANLAPFLMSHPCLVPNAPSYALSNMIDSFYQGLSLHYWNVTLMNVSSHIILRRFLAVELYLLYYLGDLSLLLFLPLQMCMFILIYISMKEKKPKCPLKSQQLDFMVAHFYFTSAKAMPRNEFNSLKTQQNQSSTAQKVSNGISFFSLRMSPSSSKERITKSIQNFFPSIQNQYKIDIDKQQL